MTFPPHILMQLIPLRQVTEYNQLLLSRTLKEILHKFRPLNSTDRDLYVWLVRRLKIFQNILLKLCCRRRLQITVQEFHRHDRKSVRPLDKAGTTALGVRDERFVARRVRSSFINFFESKYSSLWVIRAPGNMNSRVIRTLLSQLQPCDHLRQSMLRESCHGRIWKSRSVFQCSAVRT